jgi:hypothetical protein
MHGNIYTAKVNSITPWACIQRPAKWVGGDPNPGTAFRIAEDGTYEVLRGYYYYKLLCRAGQPGMAVAWAMAMDSEVALIGFARNGSKHPDALVLVNIAKGNKRVAVRVKGCGSRSFDAYRTSDAGDRFASVGESMLTSEDVLDYTAPGRSATAFYAR